MKIALLTIVIMMTVELFGQDEGFLYTTEARLGYCAIEVANDYFIVSANKTNTETNWQEIPSQLLKISPEGTLLKMTDIGENYTRVAFLHRDNNSGLVYAIGNHWDNAEAVFHPFVACFDSDLNMLSFTDVFDFNVSYTQYMDVRAVVNDNNMVLFVLTTYFWRYLGFFTLDGEYRGCLSEINNNGGSGSPFLFHDDNKAFGHFGGLGEGLRKVDDGIGINTLFTLNVIQDTVWMGSDTAFKLSMFNDPYLTCKSLPDNTFLIASMSLDRLYSNLPNTSLMENNALFVKCDTLGHVLDYLLFDPWNDTIDRPAYYQAIDYQYDNAVYLCSFQQLQHDLHGPEFNGNRIVVTKTDSELNMLWQKRYQLGNSYYVPTYTIATSDGGCLVVGYSYNVDNSEQMMLFVLKLDSNGVLSIPEVCFDTSLCPYALFPNPVDDRLNLEFSPDVTPKQVELYDLQGRLIKTQDSSLESIGMSDLPPGTYSLRIVMNDGTSYSDIVLKR